MIHKLFPAALLLLVACNQTPNNANSEKMNYPQTCMDNTVDTYFGTQIADPYRWLEDDRSAETAEWVKQQNNTAFAFRFLKVSLYTLVHIGLQHVSLF